MVRLMKLKDGTIRRWQYRRTYIATSWVQGHRFDLLAPVAAILISCVCMRIHFHSCELTNPAEAVDGIHADAPLQTDIPYRIQHGDTSMRRDTVLNFGTGFRIPS